MTHCLIADDSAVILKVARRICEGFDFTVAEAEDGAQALDECRRSMPDFVLVDWSMPVMDGFAFLKALRQEEGGDHPKVVLCMTENDVAQIARAMRAGADDHLLKPFDKEAVTAKLQDIGLI